MARIDSARLTLIVCCLLLGGLAGCTRPIDPNAAVASVNQTNMQRLANLYFTYQMKHGWRGPKDETDFSAFLNSFDPEKLTRIGIDPSTIDQLFVSERDGEPFKIRYSVRGSAMGCSEPVVFESTGVDGKRLVGFLDMNQREVDQAEYDQLWAGKGLSSQPSRKGL